VKTARRPPPGRNHHRKTLVVDGYGIRVAVERGHLVINDGTGRHRHEQRFAKVGHGIGRLLVAGHTGTITLEAIRWLNRVGIPYTHIDHDSTILTGHANPGVDDPRLRRAQALAPTTPAGLAIATELVVAKLRGQARNAVALLGAPALAASIDAHADRATEATGVDELAAPEQRGAFEYWGGWIEHVTVRWAKNDYDGVPEHWTRFPRRRSQFTSNSARASDPTNALLNYLYCLAEIECRTACIRLGLDPGLGIIHTDRPNRDSLALDLLEAIRPDVDAYVLNLLLSRVFRRRDFHERDDGEIRILAPLTHELAETLPLWASAIAPYAEDTRRHLAKASPYDIGDRSPLTNQSRRSSNTVEKRPVRRISAPKICPDCGAKIPRIRSYCDPCAARRQDEGRQRARATSAAKRVADPAFRARVGRAVSGTKIRQKAETIRAHGYTEADWQRLYPKVAELSLQQIMNATGLAITQASRIKRGAHIPHPRHWATLTEVGATRT
jgi:CRISPR-associated endonuclease Cas1